MGAASCRCEYFRQLHQLPNLVADRAGGGKQVGRGGFAFGIVPAGVHSGVARAFHIGGERVADHQGARFCKVWDAGKDIVVELLARLLEAGLLRDKDVAEIGGEAAAGKAAALRPGEAVGEDIEPAAQRKESLTELEGVGQRLGAVAEIVQILLIKR